MLFFTSRLAQWMHKIRGPMIESMNCYDFSFDKKLLRNRKCLDLFNFISKYEGRNSPELKLWKDNLLTRSKSSPITRSVHGEFNCIIVNFDRTQGSIYKIHNFILINSNYISAR